MDSTGYSLKAPLREEYLPDTHSYLDQLCISPVLSSLGKSFFCLAFYFK